MMNLTPTILTIEQAAIEYRNVCGIYQITHCNLGIVYIGQSVKVGYRLKQHFYDLAAGNHSSGLLQRAWAMGGEASFTADLIESCTPAELDSREQHWMKKNPQLLNEKVKQSVRGLGRPKPKREPRPIVRPIRPAVDALAAVPGPARGLRTESVPTSFALEPNYAAAKAAGIFGEGR